MTRQETISLLDVIFVYRPFYKTTLKDEEDFKRLIDEWFSKLKDYEFKDVKDNLDSFLRNNESRIPTPFDLNRGIRTINQKNQKGIQIYCDVCHKPLDVYLNEDHTRIDRFDADNHIERCHSVRYLQHLYRKWWKKEIPLDEIQKLKEMNREKFYEIYYSILKKAYNLMDDGTEEKFLAGKVLEMREQD